MQLTITNTILALETNTNLRSVKQSNILNTESDNPTL